MCRTRNLSNSKPGLKISSHHPFKHNLQPRGNGSAVPMQHTLIKSDTNSLITFLNKGKFLIIYMRLLLFIRLNNFLNIFQYVISTFKMFQKRMLLHFMTSTVDIMSKMLESAWCLNCTLLWCAYCQPHSIHMWNESSQWWQFGLWIWLWQCVVMYIVKNTSKAAGSYENTVDSLHDYKVLQRKSSLSRNCFT